MNKYQKYLIENSSLSIEFSVFGEEKKKNCYLEEKIVITQDEDITKIKYNLYLEGEYIVKAFFIKNKKETLLKTEEYKTTGKCGRVHQYFLCELNFEDKIDGIKISFIDGLADDLFIPIVFIEADKEKYYAKKEQERKDNLLKVANIKVSTGTDLVNIYFQPCCDSYEYTEIQLYIPKDYVTVGGPYGPVKKPSTWSMIKKSKVDIEDFYKSISGLAYGKYSFILKQYDKNNNLLLETDYIGFSIDEPVYPDPIPVTVI